MPRTLSIDSTSACAQCARLMPMPKIEAMRQLQPELRHCKWTWWRNNKLITTGAQPEEQGISKFAWRVKNLKNLLPVSRIVLFSPKLRNCLPFQKLSRKIRRFLRKLETFFNLKKGFLFLKNETKIEKISQMAENSFLTKWLLRPTALLLRSTSP